MEFCIILSLRLLIASDAKFHMEIKTDYQSQANPPLPFGRICFVVLVMRKEGRAVEVFPGI